MLFHSQASWQRRVQLHSHWKWCLTCKWIATLLMCGRQCTWHAGHLCAQPPEVVPDLYVHCSAQSSHKAVWGMQTLCPWSFNFCKSVVMIRPKGSPNHKCSVLCVLQAKWAIAHVLISAVAMISAVCCVYTCTCSYAIGDCCANPSNPLPALAQVAEQQGRYLAAKLNEEVWSFPPNFFNSSFLAPSFCFSAAIMRWKLRPGLMFCCTLFKGGHFAHILCTICAQERLSCCARFCAQTLFCAYN
jgi:hypothetical protein